MGVMQGSLRTIRFEPEVEQAIDQIRRAEDPIPSFSEVVRQLTRLGLDERKRSANKRELARG